MVSKIPQSGCLILLRHGSTVANSVNDSADRIRGWLDLTLDDKGKEEAEQAANTLLKSKANIQEIHSSNLERARETAEIVSKKLGNLSVADSIKFRPWNLGTMQGSLSKDVQPQLHHYVEHPDEKVPEGESFNDFKNRFLPSLANLLAKTIKSNGNILIVTHYRCIKLSASWIAKDSKGDDIDKKTFFQNDVNPGALVYIDLNNNG